MLTLKNFNKEEPLLTRDELVTKYYGPINNYPWAGAGGGHTDVENRQLLVGELNQNAQAYFTKFTNEGDISTQWGRTNVAFYFSGVYWFWIRYNENTSLWEYGYEK